MARLSRVLLWGTVLGPIIILPLIFISSRIWLSHHLRGTLTFGDFHLHLARPKLAWNYNFSTDSITLKSPTVEIQTSHLVVNFRFWQSLVSIRPNLEILTDSMKIKLIPEEDHSDSWRTRKRNKLPPVFPNIRIPLPFQIKVKDLSVVERARFSTEIKNVTIVSEGPKGVAAQSDSFSTQIFAVKDSSLTSPFSSPGLYRISAHWFGRSVKYQVRFELNSGDYIKMEGGHRKTNLYKGVDSVDISIARISDFNSLFPMKLVPELSNIRLTAALSLDTHLTLRTRAILTTPPTFGLGHEHFDMSSSIQDSSGHLVLSTRGDSGESAYLQGQFKFSSPIQNRHHRFLSGLSTTLSGYTRNVRLPIGGKRLPGDLEIRRITIHPGLTVDAEVKTKDSSNLILKLFKNSSALGEGARMAKGKSISKWVCAFSGVVDSRESWAHAWTDTNIFFRQFRVSGVMQQGRLECETWLKTVGAYGAVADSLYASHTVDKKGYTLNASKLYLKDVIWPVTGNVEWGGPKKNHGKKRNVSLFFQTKHPQYGSMSYRMPRQGQMLARAENVSVEHVPYLRISKFFPLKPTVSGSFDWDWAAKTGLADIQSLITYKGERLGLDINGSWDSQRLSIASVKAQFGGSNINVSGDLRMNGRQFYQLKNLKIHDVQGLALETQKFDASRLAVFLGPKYPINSGVLNGRLAYTDTTGFHGRYEVEQLDLKPIHKQLQIPHLVLSGNGESLYLTLRTLAAPGFPWFNDSVSLTVRGILNQQQSLILKAESDDGLNMGFVGKSIDFRNLDGFFSLHGRALLPGQGGVIDSLSLRGHVTLPFSNELVKQLVVDSGSFGGRYAVPGLDTQSFHGSASVREGRLTIPELLAENTTGPTLSGSADCDFNGPPRVTARLKGKNISMKWPGLQRLVLQEVEANLRVDTTGLLAEAQVGSAEFQTSSSPVKIKGVLEALSLSYRLPPVIHKGVNSSEGTTRIPQLIVKTKIRNFLFQHKLGFREIQQFFRTVKVDKRKKRIKPVDIQIAIETQGKANRIETDILRMNLTGDLNIKGIYPYTALSGEFSALSGEIGQSSQSYDITDFDLKWQNATMEEGRVSIEGTKKLKFDCKPDTKRTCNVFIKLGGRLDEMAFTYDSDCGGNSGESIEPTALINSVTRGCYSDQYIAGSGGGNYGEAVVNFLEPAINEKLSSVGNQYSLGWIKSTQVTGIGSVISSDTTGAEPISIVLETKEKWGMSLKGKAGYHPEGNRENPWENKGALEWRPPLERVAQSSEWKRRVRDRVMLEASVEMRPEDKVGVTETKTVRKQVGINYHYKFWDLW